MGTDTVDPAVGELDPAAVEEEDRGAREVATSARSVFVASTIDPEIVIVLEPFWMRQEHDTDGERAEAELVGDENLARTANRATTMANAELGGYDEDVVILLLVTELLEHVRRLSRLAEPVGTELTFTVVVELVAQGLLDHGKHFFDCFTVGGGDRLPLRDGEPSFDRFWKLTFSNLLAGVADAGEQLAQTVGLFGDSLGLVAREVAVVAGDFLVLELVGDRQIFERGECRSADCFGEFAAVFDDALCARFVETERIENLLDGVGAEAAYLFDLAVGGQLLSNLFHELSPRCIRTARISSSPLLETSCLELKLSHKKLVSKFLMLKEQTRKRVYHIVK